MSQSCFHEWRDAKPFHGNIDWISGRSLVPHLTYTTFSRCLFLFLEHGWSWEDVKLAAGRQSPVTKAPGKNRELKAPVGLRDSTFLPPYSVHWWNHTKCQHSIMSTWHIFIQGREPSHFTDFQQSFLFYWFPDFLRNNDPCSWNGNCTFLFTQEIIMMISNNCQIVFGNYCIFIIKYYLIVIIFKEF